jgi:predicted ester cyclase
MSTEQNAALVRQYFERWGDPDFTRQTLAPDFVGHLPEIPEPLKREAFIQYQGVVRAAFPNFAPTLEYQVAAGDKVVNRLVFRGTHKGDLQGIPPTGKQVTVTAITIERVVDGKIVEHWIQYDALGMMQQLGVIPAPGQSG